MGFNSKKGCDDSWTACDFNNLLCFHLVRISYYLTVSNSYGDENVRNNYNLDMNELYKNLKIARKLAKLTQDDIAKACGVSRNAVTQWEAVDADKRTEPSIDKLTIISKLTSLTVSELISGIKQEIREPSPHYNTEPANGKHDEAPLISNVQAGAWAEGIDLFHTNDAEKWIRKPKGGKRCYYLRVKGESMTCSGDDTFPEGTLILIDPDEQWCNGSFVVAKRDGEDGVTFKQLKYTEQDRPYLKALNPSDDWPNIYSGFRVLGKMISMLKLY